MKYFFTTSNGDNWVFYGETEGKKRHLMNTTQTPVKRHVKIRGEANPYDPQWEEYYEKRLDVHMATKLREEGGYFTSGKNKTASARSVNKRSLRSLAGKAITSSGDPKVDQTEPKTASCFIPHVISKSIVKEKP